jgi:protein gp37
MGDTTTIGWTEHTWNPWQGCRKVSPGCKFCYMYRDKERYGQDPTKVVRSKGPTFNKPRIWNEEAAQRCKRELVFTCSWSDWFIEEADPWRDEAWALVRESKWLVFQILTKRADRILDHLPSDWGNGYENTLIGVSVEDQKAADERIPALVKVPGRRFLSIEPMLGPVVLRDEWLAQIHWAIIGGESGPKARDFDVHLAGFTAAQLRRAEIPVFMKQLGDRPTDGRVPITGMGRHGENWDLWTRREDTAALRVRQFPVVAP